MNCCAPNCAQPSEFVIGTATDVPTEPHWHVCRDHVTNALVSAFEEDPQRGALVIEDGDVPTHNHDARRN